MHKDGAHTVGNSNEMMSPLSAPRPKWWTG